MIVAAQVPRLFSRDFNIAIFHLLAPPRGSGWVEPRAIYVVINAYWDQNGANLEFCSIWGCRACQTDGNIAVVF